MVRVSLVESGGKTLCLEFQLVRRCVFGFSTLCFFTTHQQIVRSLSILVKSFFFFFLFFFFFFFFSNFDKIKKYNVPKGFRSMAFKVENC